MVQPRPSLRTDERGQALVEYAMVIALVGACLVFILGVVGNAAHHAFARSSAELSNATPKPQGGGGAGGSGVVLVGSSGGGHSGPRPTVPPPDSASGEPDDSTEGGNPVSR